MIRSNAPVETVDYGKSVIPDNRFNYLSSLCRETLFKSPGNVCEVGVYRGGTLIELAKIVKEVCPQYKVFGIDTFRGHPYTDGHPVHPKGKYSDVDINKLKELIKNIDLDNFIILFEGKVEEIWNNLQLENISFAHIDCDLYIPIKYCAENIPKKMNKDSVIYFDDYGHDHCAGATKAVLEIFNKNILNDIYLSDDDTLWSCYTIINPQ